MSPSRNPRIPRSGRNTWLTSGSDLCRATACRVKRRRRATAGSGLDQMMYWSLPNAIGNACSGRSGGERCASTGPRRGPLRRFGRAMPPRLDARRLYRCACLATWRPHCASSRVPCPCRCRQRRRELRGQFRRQCSADLNSRQKCRAVRSRPNCNLLKQMHTPAPYAAWCGIIL